MCKVFTILMISFLVMQGVFAYSIKVYDEYGNRVGTYKKEGDNYQLYDFNDNKVDNPETLIKNVPSQRTLTEYTQILYDENMMPIGTLRSGLYSSDGRYYPAGGYYFPSCWHNTRSPYIVRPSSKNHFPQYRNSINYINTSPKRFHKF